MKGCTAFYRITSVALLLALSPGFAYANGKKRAQEVAPAPSPSPVLDGKRVVAIESVQNVRIEMPDQSGHDFGLDFEARLKTRLINTGRFVVGDPISALNSLKSRDETGVPGYIWTGTYVPAATVTVSVRELSFVTGSRGERMFYGFNERFRTPFNNGTNSLPNEFPLRSVSFEPNWMDRTFDKRGVSPFDSLAGLDLGDGFNINALFAWLDVKYATYHAGLKLWIDIDAPLAGKHERHAVEVKAGGYFFDVAGAYEGYSGGISFARTDAMLKAVSRAVEGSLATIERGIQGLPLTGRIDNIAQEGDQTFYLVGTGAQTAVQPGVRFEVIGSGGGNGVDAVLQVVSTSNSGAIAKLASGDPLTVKPGQIVRQVVAGQAPANVSSLLARTAEKSRAPASLSTEKGTPGGIVVGPIEVEPFPDTSETVQLPDENLPKPAFTPGQTPNISTAQAIWKSISGGALLPYRLYRYGMYDRDYQAQADGTSNDDMSQSDGEGDASDAATLEEWVSRERREAWAKQVGLDRVAASVARPDAAPVIAVIDSGVDYNHPALHAAQWLNPQEGEDHTGWDFISGDAKPADDHYHGTEVASLITAIEPGAKILPVKVFNPWGITNSAAIYAAFDYAINHGAKIIVCAWATRQRSQAIEQGVALARDHGVLVVAAAGDRGDALATLPAYPAALAATYANVVTVTSVDGSDQLVKQSGKYANTGNVIVSFAAPGQDLHVARPRDRAGKDTSTGLAAALVAGALARQQALAPDAAPEAWLARLRADAAHIPALDASVRGGLRLRIAE